MRFLKILLIFLLIFGWIFSGWPQLIELRIKNYELRIPPEIKEAQAAVAYDAGSESHTGTTGSASQASFSWTHTPVGTPRGVLVFVFTTANADYITSVTYGGTTMTRVTGGQAIDTTTEPGRTDTFFLGASVPTGAQSIVVNRTNNTTVMYAVAYTVTAATDTTTTGIVLLNDNQVLAEQAVNDGSPGTNSVRFAAVNSGATASPPAGANSTLGPGIAFTSPANRSVSTVRETTAGQGSRNVGFSYGTSDDVAAVHIAIREIFTPTVTTQAASSVEATTATCNGTITATGGANATNAGCEWDIDTGAPYANTASTTGDYGAAPFTQSLTGLPSGTTIYARAFATNSAGTGSSTETSFLTKPAAPTSVAATDGTYTDKITITWATSTGATGYRVYRDSVDVSGLLGDVATYDDTGADAPTITSGSAAATDGSSTSQVDLSVSGASANNGTTHTYYAVASNATGNSASSTTNTGYRGVGALTYQWQRSAADSDLTYSNITGATASTYSDINAPTSTITAGTASATDGTFTDKVALSVSGASANNGEGRYYKVVLNATGASQQTSASDRGYRGVGSLTYQWQRSAADSDASYSDIAGATTATYDDTGAPADGSGRYYKVIENATGATQQTSASDRGYRAVGTVTCGSNISSTDFGTLTSVSISTASPNASTTMSCTYAAGCILYVKDAGSGSQAGLYKSTSPTYTIVSATAALSAGTDGYGIQAATSTVGSGTLNLNSIYDKTGNNVGGLSLTDVVLASSTAAITNREVIVTHKAAITSTATAGSYSDTITYSCVGN